MTLNNPRASETVKRPRPMELIMIFAIVSILVLLYMALPVSATTSNYSNAQTNIFTNHGTFIYYDSYPSNSFDNTKHMTGDFDIETNTITITSYVMKHFTVNGNSIYLNPSITLYSFNMIGAIYRSDSHVNQISWVENCTTYMSYNATHWKVDYQFIITPNYMMLNNYSYYFLITLIGQDVNGNGNIFYDNINCTLIFDATPIIPISVQSIPFQWYLVLGITLIIITIPLFMAWVWKNGENKLPKLFYGAIIWIVLIFIDVALMQ